MRLLAIALAALLTLGLALPAAMAEGPMQARRGRPASDRHPADLADVRILLEGTGLDRENASYRFSLEGAGKAFTRQPGGNLTALRAEIVAYAKLVDANGSLVKEGRIRLFLFAKEGADGNWTWHAMSVAHFPRGLPHLFLRGTSEGPQDGSLPLDGRGRVAVRADEGPLRVRLDVEGALTRA